MQLQEERMDVDAGLEITWELYTGSRVVWG